MAMPMPVPAEVASICTCTCCGERFVPNYWDSFGENGYGSCDGCWPDGSPFERTEWIQTKSPSKERAAAILKCYWFLFK